MLYLNFNSLWLPPVPKTNGVEFFFTERRQSCFPSVWPCYQREIGALGSKCNLYFSWCLRFGEVVFIGLRFCFAFSIVCRSCIVKHLQDENICPTCKIVIHHSYPMNYIRWVDPRGWQGTHHYVLPKRKEIKRIQVIIMRHLATKTVTFAKKISFLYVFFGKDKL